MTRSTPRMAALLLLSSTLALGQTSGGSTGGTTSSGSGGTRGGGTTTPTTTRGNTTLPPVQDQQRPINLAGRVVMEDGTPPSDKVSIERVCNGRARREAYTDSKGYFSFMIDNSHPQMIMQDASVGSDSLDSMTRIPSTRSSAGSYSMPDLTGTRTLDGCELRAVMPGAVSETIQLTGRRAFDDPNVGTIVLRRTSRVAGATISLTSMQAPGNARKAFEHGKKSLEKGDEAGARTDFAKAVELYPNYADAWAELADLYLKAKDTDNARAACEHALAADARFVRPYFMLIVMAASQENWKQTQEYSEKLLALDSYSYAAAYYYNALANLKLHNLDKADVAVKAARKIDPNNKLPKIGLLMATIMMERKDFAGAVQELRSYLDHAPANGSDADYARTQLTFAQNKLASAGPAASAAGSPK